MSFEKIIIYVLAVMFTMVIDLMCYRLLTKEKVQISLTNVILFIGLSIISVVTNIYSNSAIKLIINFATKIIILKVFYNLKINKAVYYATMLWILLMIIELCSTIFISYLNVKTPQEFLKNYFHIKIGISIIMSTTQLLLILIPLVKKALNFGYEKIKKITYNTQLLTVTIISMTLLAILNTFNMDNMGSHYIVLCIIVIICALMILIIFLTNKQLKLKDLNKAILENNNTYIEMADNYATLRHNIINQFLTIKSVSNKKTQSLIDEMINDYETQYKVITNVHKIPKGLKGIIYQKIYQLDDKDIKVNVVNSLKNDPFLKLKPKKYNDLCEIIGILIDNAVEGAVTSHEKVIYIEFDQIKNSKDINIVIINTFNGEIDLDLFGDRHYTTKKSGHGIGVNYVLKKNAFEISNKIINNLFKVEIKIKDAN